MNLTSLPNSVLLLRELHISGNVTPLQWFKSITTENGKPDLLSITLLSDIVYWYRPREIRDERSLVIGYEKKFSEDLLRRSYRDFEDMFGLSIKQIQRSLQRLEDLGLIERIFRSHDTPFGRCNNVMYIDLNVSKLRAITYDKIHEKIVSEKSPTLENYNQTLDSSCLSTPMDKNVHRSSHECPEGETLASDPMDKFVHTPGQKCPDHIKESEITPKISSEITLSQETSSPSSKNEERELAYQMLKIWNEIIPEQSVDSLPTYQKNLLTQAYSGQLDQSLAQWKVVCENFKSSKFLMGEAEGVRIKPNLSWLLIPEKQNLLNVLHKTHFTFDDRVISSGKVNSEKFKQDIFSLDECDEAKRFRVNLLKDDHHLYLADVRHSKISVSESKLSIGTRFQHSEERLKDFHGLYLKKFVKENHGKDVEVYHEKNWS